MVLGRSLDWECGLESITALGSGDTQSSGEPSDGNILTILSDCHYTSILVY